MRAVGRDGAKSKVLYGLLSFGRLRKVGATVHRFVILLGLYNAAIGLFNY